MQHTHSSADVGSRPGHTRTSDKSLLRPGQTRAPHTSAQMCRTPGCLVPGGEAGLAALQPHSRWLARAQAVPGSWAASSMPLGLIQCPLPLNFTFLMNFLHGIILGSQESYKDNRQFDPSDTNIFCGHGSAVKTREPRVVTSFTA